MWRRCRSNELVECRKLVCVRIVDKHEAVAEPFAEGCVAVEDVGFPASHPGTEVEPYATEDHDGAGGHVLTAVVAYTFDHGHRAGVANREPLTRRACAVELSTRRAVQHRVADEARIARIVGRRGDHDAATAHRLAHAVVRVADEVELDTRGEECTEALSRGALEARTHAARRRRRACDPSDCAAEPGSDRTIAVRDLMARLDERRVLERRAALCVEEDPEPVARVPRPCSGEASGPFRAPAR